MGKSSSKLSVDSISDRLRNQHQHHHHHHQQQQQNNNPEQNGQITNYRLNEKELRKWCRGFNKDFPDAQLTSILDNEHLLAPFLTDIFYQEVEVSDCMQTLFRGNCLASKIMSHCFRTFGSKYLKQLLQPHIKPLTDAAIIYHHKSKSKNDNNSAFNSPKRTSRLSADATANIENNAQLNSNSYQSDYSLNNSMINNNERNNINSFSYEIDAARLEEDGNIDVNQRNLLRLTQEILNSILSSADDFPPQLNSMCICLRQVLCRKYPNSNTNLKAVGTVIFLRFINPAIVSPLEAGIVDIQPHPKILRGLMLVSKILQNIANNVEFSKEEHMLPFNDFVRAQFEPIRRWVSEISSEKVKPQSVENEESI